MKVAYFAQSPGEKAAFIILTEAVLKLQTEPFEHSGLRERGWSAVSAALPALLKDLHENTDADGVVLVMDSDGDAPHLTKHELPKAAEPKCRLCELRRITRETQAQLGPRPGRPPLKIALGLAAPALEAWLLCGVDPQVTETAWINGFNQAQIPYTRESLRQKLYGASEPTAEVETEVMKAAATRLVQNFPLFEKLFPHGFGTLQRNLRNW